MLKVFITIFEVRDERVDADFRQRKYTSIEGLVLSDWFTHVENFAFIFFLSLKKGVRDRGNVLGSKQ